MGWLYTNKPVNVKKYMDGVYSMDNEHVKLEVLDSAIVSFREYYAAVRRTDKVSGEVTVAAGVAMLDYRPHDQFDFGYKDMDETAGPYQTACPKRIMKLLTAPYNEYATNWRRTVNERHARRDMLNKYIRELRVGDIIELSGDGLTFGTYGKHTQAYMQKTGRNIEISVYANGAGTFGISRNLLARCIKA